MKSSLSPASPGCVQVGLARLAGSAEEGHQAARGWSRARIDKLLGGNFLRLFREAWGG